MKILNILIVSFIIFLTNFGFLYSQEVQAIVKSRDQYLEDARNLAEAGEDEKLDKLMAEMLEKYPDDSDALCHKGMLLMNNGKLDEAERLFNLAVSNRPDFTDGYILLGVVSMFRGDQKKEGEFYKKAISIDPKSRAHANLGGLYFRQKKYNEALDELKLFLKYNKKESRIYRSIGEIHYIQGNYKAAAIAFTNALQHGDPRDILNLMDLGRSYEALGDIYHAKQTYEIANEWHGYDKEVREALSRVNEKIKLQESSK